VQVKVSLEEYQKGWDRDTRVIALAYDVYATQAMITLTHAIKIFNGFLSDI
jgi:hypothetical protein